MASRHNCKFAYYVFDKKTADVSIEDGVVTSIHYTEDPMDLPFGCLPDRLITRKTIDLFFEEHCVPRTRVNIREILDYHGLKEFDAYALCRITNGVCAGEPYRIEWKD